MTNFDLLKQKTKKQALIWKIIGSVLPMTGFMALAISYWIGAHQTYYWLIISGTCTFLFIAAIWWWWAIDKISSVVELMSQAADKFKEVKKDINTLKEDINNNK